MLDKYIVFQTKPTLICFCYHKLFLIKVLPFNLISADTIFDHFQLMVLHIRCAWYSLQSRLKC